MENIVLIGFMGAGKTTVGNLLAEKLHLPVIDLDQVITTKIQMPINEFFAQQGEAAFREIEETVLAEHQATPAIIATGGGIILNEVNRELLKNHPAVVYLTAEDQVLLERIKGDQTNIRPLAAERSSNEILALFQQRKSLYETCSTLTIDTTGKKPAAIVQEIIEGLEEK